MNEKLRRIDKKIITNPDTKSRRKFSKGQLRKATELPHAPTRLTSPTHQSFETHRKTTQRTGEKRLHQESK